MEITFENGEVAVKAIKVSLLDDGSFAASFDDYNIAETDEFIRRPDSKAISRSEDGDNTGVDRIEELTDEDIETAREVAIRYYAGTVFEVNQMEYIESGTNELVEGKCNFIVNVSQDGMIQEVDRIIMLNKVDGLWKVVNEGY